MNVMNDEKYAIKWFDGPVAPEVLDVEANDSEDVGEEDDRLDDEYSDEGDDEQSDDDDDCEDEENDDEEEYIVEE